MTERDDLERLLAEQLYRASFGDFSTSAYDKVARQLARVVVKAGYVIPTTLTVGLDVERVWEAVLPFVRLADQSKARQALARLAPQPSVPPADRCDRIVNWLRGYEAGCDDLERLLAETHAAFVAQPALSPEAVPEVPSEPPDPSALRESLDALDAALDPDHPEGHGCSVCVAADDTREAFERVFGPLPPTFPRPFRAEPERERAAHTHELKIGAREYDPDGVVQTWQMYCVGCDQAGRFTIPDEEKDWIEPEPTAPPTVKRERAEGTSFGEAGATPFGKAGDTSVTPSGNPLDVAWREVADAVVDRPYPGTDINYGGWCIQLFGYPPTSIGGTPETRYHAMATPAIDSHHRNTVKATGPTPSAALQALLTALSSQSPDADATALTGDGHQDG